MERPKLKEGLLVLSLAGTVLLGATACAQSSEKSEAQVQSDQQRDLEKIRQENELKFTYDGNGRLYIQLVHRNDPEDIVSTTVSECQGPDLVEMSYGGPASRVVDHRACVDDGFLSRDEIELPLQPETVIPPSAPR